MNMEVDQAVKQFKLNTPAMTIWGGGASSVKLQGSGQKTIVTIAWYASQNPLLSHTNGRR